MYSRMSSRCLFIDGCNVFIRSINFNTTPREWFNQQKEHIDRFVNAAKKSKYQLIVYFDTMPAETKIVTEADLKRQLKQSYYKLPGHNALAQFSTNCFFYVLVISCIKHFPKHLS